MMKRIREEGHSASHWAICARGWVGSYWKMLISFLPSPVKEFHIARTCTEYRIIVRTLSNHGRRTGSEKKGRKSIISISTNMGALPIIFLDIVTWELVHVRGSCVHGMSWPSSPPHWLSRKRNTGHVKPPSPSYFVNFRYLHRSNGLIVRTLAAVDGFSRALAISVFDSLWMYCFCGVLTSLFYVLLVTFYFLLIFYCSLCSSLIFIWP